MKTKAELEIEIGRMVVQHNIGLNDIDRLETRLHEALQECNKSRKAYLKMTKLADTLAGPYIKIKPVDTWENPVKANRI